MESRRKKVNIVTVTGIGTEIAGSVMAGVGIALVPVTAGTSLALSFGGVALAAAAGSVVTGTKVTESILNRGTIQELKRYQNCYQERLENLKSVMEELKKKLKKLDELSETMLADKNYEASDYVCLQSISGIVHAVEGLAMIPVGVLRMSVGTLSIISAVVGPLTALIDIAFLAFTVRNMMKGNKSDATENLRRLSASLYASRRQMHNWAYGNKQPFDFC